jgi:fused signal recognition particle receptor
MGSASEDEMPLLCELGWHRADPLARWNAGYYFTTCERCGEDLVRTAYGGWRVPRGYRVVWQSKAPETARAAELIPDGSLDRAPVDQMELPIQELLRQLEADEGKPQPDYEEPDLQESFFDELAPEEPPLEEPALEEPALEEEAQETAEEPAEEVAEAAVEEPVEEIAEAAAEEPVEELVGADGDMGPEPVEEVAAIEAAPAVDPEPARRAPPRAAEVDPLMDDDWFLKEEPAGSAWDEFVGDYERERGLRPAGETDPRPDDGPENGARKTIRHQSIEDSPPSEAERPFSGAEAASGETDVHEVIEDDERERIGNRSGKIRFGREVAAVVSSGAALFGRFRRRSGEPGDALIEDGSADSNGSEASPSLQVGDSSVEQPAQDGDEEEGGKKDEDPNPTRAQVAITAGASFGVLVVVAAVIGGSSSSQTKSADQSAAKPEPVRASMSQPLQTGFVTASLLNCRTSPAEQAKSVRRLPRGEPVEILALEPAWASISHRGRQCWASTRYISTEQPL